MTKILFLLCLTLVLQVKGGCDDEIEEDDGFCEPVTAFDFEVFGKVQGVYFRKHTKQMADKLNLVGFVQNTSEGTVVGTVQGSKKNIDEMENWLRNVGSPQSKIEKMERKRYRILQKAEFQSFEINK